MPPETPSDALRGTRVRFFGDERADSLGPARQLVRDHGGELTDGEADWIVIADDELPWIDDQLLDAPARHAAEEGRTEILTLSQFWDRVGVAPADICSKKLYTPAMLAELIGVPLATVRRWHRRGLLKPVREVHRLAYFDFQEVVSARKLAAMLAAGISPVAIEKKLAALSRHVRGVERSLAQLSVIVEGRQILLRQGEGLIEPSGQLRFDFQALESSGEAATELAEPSTVSFVDFLAQHRRGQSPESMLEAASVHEENGDLAASVEMYRAALAAGGPTAQGCFQLAELLYRLGDVTAARERYYMAIELDDTLVEARANLGCLLAEHGELELAIAAFQGALSLHTDYADVHYHLARALSELNRHSEARQHWQEFLQLTPDSPWADEARMALERTNDE